VWAVFLGRFVALLRILAGPLAGALRVPYRRFLLANAAGGIVWSFGTAIAVYLAGHAAERYLKDFSWLALVAAILAGIATTLYLRRRAGRAEVAIGDGDGEEAEPTPSDSIAAATVHAAGDPPAAAIEAIRTAANRGGTKRTKADRTAPGGGRPRRGGRTRGR
jgi:hypothetical protein